MSRPVPDETAARLFDAIRKACVGNDYGQFGAVVSERMKAAIPAERFGATAASLGPVLADPARISYMDALREGEHTVHFWKVDTQASAARDILMRMSVKDGQVSGLLFSAPFDTGMGKKGA